MTEPAAPDVSFYFDATCPWTWNTSRWLVAVAAERGFPITWRTFSLAVVNEGREIPEPYRSMQPAARAAVRVVEALRAEGRNDDIGRFYLDLGRRWHHDGEDHSLDTVRKALTAAGLDDLVGALDDDSWDRALRASLDEALGLAGPDIGSPVLRIGDRAMFGPIISPPPIGAAALDLWDAVRLIIPAEGIYELKRGRQGGPVAGARP